MQIRKGEKDATSPAKGTGGVKIMRYGVTVALQILVLSVQVRILISQPRARKEFEITDLRAFSLNKEAYSLQIQHSSRDKKQSYEEKKMQLKKQNPVLEYRPATVREGKVWYIVYYIRYANSEKFIRIREKFNSIKPIAERRRCAKKRCKLINDKLEMGYNPPYIEEEENYISIEQATQMFLQSKEREAEYHTMRVYRSFTARLLEWLPKHGIDKNSYITQLDNITAIRYMENVEKNVKPITYNNYLRFSNIFCNWMVEHAYLESNPFSGIKRKPKKLTKKKRRILSEEELKVLWEYLEQNNPSYLLVCLICYCCLMRPKEIALLKCRDILIDKSMIYVSEEIAKNDNESFRTIPDELRQLLSRINLSHKDWYLFSGDVANMTPGPKKVWSQRFSDYWRHVVRPACGFSDDVQLYSLKDSGITYMLTAGLPTSIVKQQADHSDLSMTSVYLSKTDKANEALKHIDIIGL